MPALQKIAEIQIEGEPLDLAKNGQFCLVWQKGPDAYGRPVAERVALTSYFGVNATGEHRIQALLDLLGDALVRLGQQRDARLGRGGGGVVKKSEFKKNRASTWARVLERGYPSYESAEVLVDRDIEAAEAAGVAWDPESEPGQGQAPAPGPVELPERLHLEGDMAFQPGSVPNAYAILTIVRTKSWPGQEEHAVRTLAEAVRRYNEWPDLESRWRRTSEAWEDGVRRAEKAEAEVERLGGVIDEYCRDLQESGVEVERHRRACRLLTAERDALKLAVQEGEREVARLRAELESDSALAGAEANVSTLRRQVAKLKCWYNTANQRNERLRVDLDLARKSEQWEAEQRDLANREIERLREQHARLQGLLIGERAAAWAAWDESRRQAIEACAAEVKAAGCPQARCGKDALAHEVPEAFEDESGVWHYPWCPVALAARLRRLA